MTSVISKKVDLKIPVTRKVIQVDLTQTEEVNHSLALQEKRYDGFRKAVKISRKACTEAILNETLDLYDRGKVVLDTKARQESFRNMLLDEDIPDKEIFLISSKNPINYNYNSKTSYRVLITTVTSSTGYSITKANYLLTSVYFTGS